MKNKKYAKELLLLLVCSELPQSSDRQGRERSAGKAWGSLAPNRVVGSWAAAQAAEPAWQAAIRKDTASQE